MHRNCSTNYRAPRWTFTDPCKPEVRPGAREESASPAWLAAPTMNARDTTKGFYGRLTLDVDRHYIGRATPHQEKGIITLESNPSRETVLLAPEFRKNIWKFLRSYSELLSKFGDILFQEYVSKESLTRTSTVI